ncbi:MAG: CpsB/CapC family capsule biosynthesis tyrosine phosphatase, partial [Ruminococcus sp.]|nr:CpsB/CapC family capsule biosynthesis tyrosine phosphatase [Ruminococcus sp.]
MELYDMHSHILPAFDDGAKTVDDSLELIGHLRKQGVKNICLTPHFYTNELSYDDYLVEREEAFRAFAPHI